MEHTPDYSNPESAAGRSDSASPLTNCELCPRRCRADRTNGRLGYCRTDVSLCISSVVKHSGEEPVISGTRGICNVFFAHCNLQCRFCQNHQISRNEHDLGPWRRELPDVVGHIERLLDKGAHGVGFVSPSHMIPQMKSIINALTDRGRRPVYVYNSNGYDCPRALASLEGLIDIFLPDFKYADEQLARLYSDAPEYPEVALAAVKEMFRQTGPDLALDDHGVARSGLIIRHLVLPGQVANSKGVLRLIADEISTDVHLSLMAQYYPTSAVKNDPNLGRRLTVEEYDDVLEEFDRLGFHRGWTQQLSSAEHYRPDFESETPFET